MDNGEVISGLNEDWQFFGAKLSEWIAGFTMFLLSSELFFSSVAKVMPLLMMIWMGTTLSLAAMRRLFPDEEKGVRNMCMTSVGLPPPGIPAPAALQPYWSGAPIRSIPAKCILKELGLEEVMEERRHEDLQPVRGRSRLPR